MGAERLRHAGEAKGRGPRRRAFAPLVEARVDRQLAPDVAAPVALDHGDDLAGWADLAWVDDPSSGCDHRRAATSGCGRSRMVNGRHRSVLLFSAGPYAPRKWITTPSSPKDGAAPRRDHCIPGSRLSSR